MAEIKTLGPVGLNPLGEYNSQTEYEKLDVVLYQGSSYVALQTVQGQVPTNTEYWQKLVTGGMDIIDNLESEDTQKALSANQGKVLNDIINTDNYYDEITYTKERHYDTDCYFTRIPKNDKDNKEIVLYLSQTDVGVTPTKYARDNNTSFTINASLYLGSSVGSGSVIANGQIIEDEDLSSKSDAYKYLGIKANRVLKEYQANQTSAQEMIDDGCLQAFTVYYTLIKDNVIQDMSLIPDLDGDIAGKKHPRQCLGQLEDGTIIVLTCDGRTSINAGLTSEETAILLKEKGCINAWNLDGGGSASTTIKGCKINRNIDSNGTADRYIRNVLNAKKTILNKELADVYSQIGFEKQEIINQIIPYINDLFSRISTRYYANIDLNEKIGETILGYCNGATNKPDSSYGGYDNGFYFINIPHPQEQYRDLYNLQFFIRRDYKEIWSRRQVNGEFTDWWCVNQQNKARFTAVVGVNSNNKIITDNTYQDIIFKDNLANNNFIKPDETSIDPTNNEFSNILVDSLGYADIRVNGTIQCVSAGTKFIKIKQGDADTSAIYSFDVDTPGRYNFNLETLQRITGSTSNTFKVQMYGSIGDYLQRCNCLIDFDR